MSEGPCLFPVVVGVEMQGGAGVNHVYGIFIHSLRPGRVSTGLGGASPAP